MKLMPDVGCRGGDYHDYSFQTVYRGGPHGPANDIESIIGMCKRCGDIYMQPVTRLARQEAREETEAEPISSFGGEIRWDRSAPSVGRAGNLRSNDTVQTVLTSTAGGSTW